MPMRSRNTRNLAIILVILTLIVIVNSVILINVTGKTKAINTDENKEIIFKSSNEKVTDYAIYAFSIFCIFLVILSTVKLKNI